MATNCLPGDRAVGLRFLQRRYMPNRARAPDFYRQRQPSPRLQLVAPLSIHPATRGLYNAAKTHARYGTLPFADGGTGIIYSPPWPDLHRHRIAFAMAKRNQAHRGKGIYSMRSARVGLVGGLAQGPPPLQSCPVGAITAASDESGTVWPLSHGYSLTLRKFVFYCGAL